MLMPLIAWKQSVHILHTTNEVWEVTATRQSHRTNQDSGAEPSDYKIWGGTVFASMKEGQISVLMQEQRANGKKFQQGTTVIPWVNYCSPPTVKCPLQFNFCQWLHKDVWKGYLQVFIKRKKKKSCSVKWFLTARGTLQSNFVAVTDMTRVW